MGRGRVRGRVRGRGRVLGVGVARTGEENSIVENRIQENRGE